jgi:hypothetical protein
MARECIFCGSPRLTAEDAWPLWLGDVLPVIPGGLVGRLDTLGSRHTTRRWRLKTLTVRVKWVCEACNCGWMSVLENQAKQVLTPMIGGESTRLDQADQLLVATWAVKTAMVLEFINGETVAATREDRHWLRERRSPPPGMMARAAKYVGGIEPLHYLHIVGHDPASTATDPEPVYATTLLVGQLVLQVLGPDPRRRAAPFTQPGVVKAHFIPVLPPTLHPAIWPPATPLDDEGYAALAREPFSGSPDAALAMAELGRRLRKD